MAYSSQELKAIIGVLSVVYCSSCKIYVAGDCGKRGWLASE